MDLPITELHQVGRHMVHLLKDKIESSGEYLALMEGGGVCLANSFPTIEEADAWLNSMFTRLFRDHTCDIGCVRLPGWEFLADPEVLEEMAILPDSQQS
jgi:hypothetical protein